MERIPTGITDINKIEIHQGDVVALSYAKTVALVFVMPKKEFELLSGQKLISDQPISDDTPVPLIKYKIKSVLTGQTYEYVRALTGRVKIVGRVN